MSGDARRESASASHGNPLESPRGTVAACSAAIMGVLYALVSAYWGAGGTRLLDTIGGSLERAGRAHSVGVFVIVWATVVLKLVAVTVGLLATSLRPGSQQRRLARATAWIAAVVLVGYGGVLTAAGLLVQTGVVSAAADADQTALRWHAYLWDPWFLIWGLLLTAALWRSRPRRT